MRTLVILIAILVPILVPAPRRPTVGGCESHPQACGGQIIPAPVPVPTPVPVSQ